MAVVNDFALPAQPLESVFGTVTYIALGGDGLIAPKGAYSIRGARIAGDATGGLASINCTMDNRFTSLCQFVTGQGSGVTTSTDFKFVLTSDTQASVIDWGNDPVFVAASATNCGHTWNPPPLLLPGNEVARLEMDWPNVDGDTFFMDALIYLFDIDVRQKTPIGPLLWARGGAQA